MTVGAAVLAAGHGQVVQRAEARKTDVAANLVDGAVQNHLMFALRDEMKSSWCMLSNCGNFCCRFVLSLAKKTMFKTTESIKIPFPFEWSELKK